MIRIGIDPGVKTGIAISRDGRLRMLGTWTAVRAERYILETMITEEIIVTIEDARKKVWFGGDQKARAQGAGSVRRDSKRWQEFCAEYGIKFEMVSPQASRFKKNAKAFNNFTGWDGGSSEHSRDAAMLIYGK